MSILSAISSEVGSRPKFLEKLARLANQLVDRLDHVHGDADRAGLVGDGAGDRLANPPGGVGAELVALGVVELLDRADQADIALLDQVQQRHAAPDILLGHADHEAQISLGEATARVQTANDRVLVEVPILNQAKGEGFADIDLIRQNPGQFSAGDAGTGALVPYIRCLGLAQAEQPNQIADGPRAIRFLIAQFHYPVGIQGGNHQLLENDHFGVRYGVQVVDILALGRGVRLDAGSHLLLPFRLDFRFRLGNLQTRILGRDIVRRGEGIDAPLTLFDIDQVAQSIENGTGHVRRNARYLTERDHGMHHGLVLLLEETQKVIDGPITLAHQGGSARITRLDRPRPAGHPASGEGQSAAPPRRGPVRPRRLPWPRPRRHG